MKIAGLLFCLGLEVYVVASNYVVEVHLGTYSNPTSRAFGAPGEGCCDGPLGSSGCTDQCDNSFTLCLRPLNTQATRMGCSSMVTETNGVSSTAISDQDEIVFDLGTNSVLPNPLYLSNKGIWQGIQLYIVVNDVNQSPQRDIVVDTFTVNLTTIGATISLQNTSGLHGYGKISSNATAFCAEFYHGNQCQFLNMCELNRSLCTNGQVCVPQMNEPVCACDPQSTNCDIHLINSSNPTIPTMSAPDSTGGIIGGVVAALLVLLIAVVVFVVAVILAKRKKETTGVQVSHENGPTNYGSRESVNEAEFNNPLYGDSNFDKTNDEPLGSQEPNAYETPVAMYATVKS